MRTTVAVAHLLICGQFALAPLEARAQEPVELARRLGERVLAFLSVGAVDSMLAVSETPFLAEGFGLLRSPSELRSHLHQMFTTASPEQFPTQVLGIWRYDKTREATSASSREQRDQLLSRGDLVVYLSRNGIASGCLLIRMAGFTPRLVGLGA